MPNDPVEGASAKEDNWGECTCEADLLTMTSSTERGNERSLMNTNDLRERRKLVEKTPWRLGIKVCLKNNILGVQTTVIVQFVQLAQCF